MPKQLVAASVALRVNVTMDVVGIDNRAKMLKLVDHLVDTTREQLKLDVVDKQQCQLVNKQPRVLATEMGGVSMA